MKINGNYKNLKESYLFKTVAQKKAEYLKNHPDADIINMGIGDVTLPLCKATIDEMEKAVAEMGVKETFKGYPDYYGEPYLLDAIQNYYKTSMGVTLSKDEINVTCGAKEDVSNILDIFSSDTVAVISDPVYPVYLDSNVMAGRPVRFMAANKENDFLPMPKDAPIGDIYYLCSPNNPTGACYNYDQLKEWVAFAKKNNAVILFDAAYEIFAEPGLPRSIFEIEGAKECAIEFCSMSKTAGFTGTRCGYTVVPDDLVREGIHLRKMWLRRQTTKFNGVSYPVQCAAAAVFSEEGMKATRENIAYYQENAKIMTDTLTRLGIKFTGGVNSPYVWFKCPNNMGSWEFFDYLLVNACVVGTPGAGFGKNGEGWFRLTAFGDRDRTIEAMQRLEKLIGSAS